MERKIAIVLNRADHAGGSERYATDIAHRLYPQGRLSAVLAKGGAKWKGLKSGIPLRIIHTKWLPVKVDSIVFSIYCWLYKSLHPSTILFSCSRILWPDLTMCGFTQRGYLRALKKEPSWKDKTEIFIEAQGYKNAKLIVAHSTNMQRELVELYGVPQEKIIILHPPVERANFPLADHVTARESLARKLGIDLSGKVLFLLPSSGHQRKGLDLILSALAKFSDKALLLIAGRKQRIKEPNVIELGFVQQMAQLYAACDYTILASIYEPFGLVGIESVLCGTPLLLSNQCGCNEVLSDEVKINFAARNEEELVAAIAKAVANPFRVSEPEKNIHYDLSFDNHLSKIMALFEEKEGKV